MSIHDPIVVVAAKRTPIGALQGALCSQSASSLGATAITAAVKESGFSANDIDHAVMGCVLTAGQGQAPARQAVIGAMLPFSVPGTTVNKMCGSGMKAIMDAHDAILAGTANVIIAGGMESMSNAPYLLQKARSGYRMGHGSLMDHMFLDGLEDAYERGRLMGSFADACAHDLGITREAQDDFAVRSLSLSKAAIVGGRFHDEIVPVRIVDKDVIYLFDTDEQPEKARLDRISSLKPAFVERGTITAANSSSISDGAAALVLTRESIARDRGLTPLARVVGHAVHAQEPSQFPTAPIGAINKLLQKANWNREDVDLFEINEAFAMVAMAAIAGLDLRLDRVNVHGGACALGHPIGASGARIVVTLINALRWHGKQRGIAAVCIGGGEATALAVECFS